MFLIRLSKGAVFIDIYSFLIKPFWPGPAQKEWIKESLVLENSIRLDLLEEDNVRLRDILSIQNSEKSGKISAPVISKQLNGWSQQFELGKGIIHGISSGDVVTAPGGLLGIVISATPMTSRVRLLTSPGSRLGVWVPRIKQHGLLIGIGTSRPQIELLEKNINVQKGDIVSTSPASTVLPPNLPVGVIQELDETALPAPKGFVQLSVAPHAIDWVQLQTINP